MSSKPTTDGGAPKREPVKNLVREVTHPALIPGIGVEDTPRTFSTNWLVLGAAGVAVLGVVLWGFLAPESIAAAGSAALAWTTANFGWLFSLTAIAVFVFMLVVGYGRTGGIRLGADDEKPEFSMGAWIAMLFSAGMGIGLLFWGPSEPLVYFADVPPGVDAEPGSRDAMLAALAQSILHWGPMAWAFYALVGGAIAYVAYRRGRSPLISAILYPIFKEKTEGWIGSVIDIFAIIVTLFGTAVTLGMGTLQITAGVQIVGGLGELGNGFLIAVITILTAAFIVSAVSGVKRGIRMLSNINMVVAAVIGIVIFIAGPTLLILNMVPASVSTFFSDLWMMLARNPAQGEEAAAFVGSWTNYYWAWWISWTPFVGMFIAKISRGRTLREFVTVVIIVPSIVCVLWFGIMGGSTMFFDEQSGGGMQEMSAASGNEGVLFAVFDALQRNLIIGGWEVPISGVLSIAAMISIVLFFVTSADSAAIVMGSMSQRGKPEPSTWITIMWGVLLGAVALALLLAGGEDSLSGLQSMMVVTALPFTFILLAVMWAWGRELHTDPFMMRRRFAKAAIAQGVRRGIEEHGDDFVFDAASVPATEGAGAAIDTEDPALTDWWDTATGAVDIPEGVSADDVARTLEPGRIQKPGEPNAHHAASGDASLTVNEDRRRR
ncbi:BCCT family transporter [Microbacterium indicum]|uniref:BCCT family transporter n=1 Tax=Microbacterium indicum TaxID=358100 RepID=UPI0004052DBB|nr:BCCT family transporter [Microbacterium indicum]